MIFCRPQLLSQSLPGDTKLDCHSPPFHLSEMEMASKDRYNAANLGDRICDNKLLKFCMKYKMHNMENRPHDSMRIANGRHMRPMQEAV